MPKVKKIRSAALAGKQSRHAPLGQVIQEDENRGKYAAAVRNRGKQKEKVDKDDDDVMDERTSKQILELSREQQLEIEREEVQQHQRTVNNQPADDSEDEDGQDESVSLQEDEEE